jgi:hypothetical protein
MCSSTWTLLLTRLTDPVGLVFDADDVEEQCQHNNRDPKRRAHAGRDPKPTAASSDQADRFSAQKSAFLLFSFGVQPAHPQNIGPGLLLFLAQWQEYPWPVLTITDASHWRSPATQETPGWKARGEQREGLILFGSPQARLGHQNHSDVVRSQLKPAIVPGRGH